LAKLKSTLVEKLFKVVSGRTSQGVNNVYFEEIIPKGTKFTLKDLLGEIDLRCGVLQRMDNRCRTKPECTFGYSVGKLQATQKCHNYRA
jgi:hypothetical protein